MIHTPQGKHVPRVGRRVRQRHGLRVHHHVRRGHARCLSTRRRAGHRGIRRDQRHVQHGSGARRGRPVVELHGVRPPRPAGAGPRSCSSAASRSPPCSWVPRSSRVTSCGVVEGAGGRTPHEPPRPPTPSLSRRACPGFDPGRESMVRQGPPLSSFRRRPWPGLDPGPESTAQRLGRRCGWIVHTIPVEQRSLPLVRYVEQWVVDAGRARSDAANRPPRRSGAEPAPDSSRGGAPWSARIRRSRRSGAESAPGSCRGRNP